MRIQQHAKIQISALKSDALRLRDDFNNTKAVDKAILKELVKDYEERITYLENQINNNS